MFHNYESTRDRELSKHLDRTDTFLFILHHPHTLLFSSLICDKHTCNATHHFGGKYLWRATLPKYIWDVTRVKSPQLRGLFGLVCRMMGWGISGRSQEVVQRQAVCGSRGQPRHCPLRRRVITRTDTPFYSSSSPSYTFVFVVNMRQTYM